MEVVAELLEVVGELLVVVGELLEVVGELLEVPGGVVGSCSRLWESCRKLVVYFVFTHFLRCWELLEVVGGYCSTRCVCVFFLFFESKAY